MTEERIKSARSHAQAVLSELRQVDEIEKREETANARVSVGFLRGILNEHVELCDQLLSCS